ncbi:MAG: UDPGP type 1 family protein [Lachnospiraceae bacterium]|nr:UDPGP type 1 family protein [Lachnospiraceae bacterium]
MNYREAYEKLESAGQTHLLKYYDTLNEEEKNSLLREIESLDLSFLSLIDEPDQPTRPDDRIEPLPAMTAEEIEAEREELEKLGIETIRAGKTAAVLLAGGQGTRLGFDHPKGMYDLGLTKPRYIFQCLFENLLDVTNKAGAYIPFCIMTSEINHDETVAFLKEKSYFGYPEEYVRFFVQDMAPCTDFDGKIYLASRSHIAMSPNGNGGWYHSMKKAGLDRELKARGVEYLSAFAVDNVLQRINDPAFVGAVVRSNTDVGSKAIAKADPYERVGVLCRKNGHPSIVEYYEITDDMANLRDESGRLLYRYGVILNYLFKLDKLENVVSKRMPVHMAKKKIPYLNEGGVFVKPETPNGYKFELLILDMIELMDSSLAYEVRREKEFAPVKNPNGVDSVESARELLKLNGIEL